MSKVNTSVASRKRKKKVLKLAKGFRGNRKTRYRRAKESLLKALSYQTRDRKTNKRTFRALWISRLSIACRKEEILYSRFIKRLKDLNILLDRKVLSDLAINNPKTFTEIVNMAKAEK
ncbi:MAG: 50S ribosomal protein L20 [bacterium]